MSSCERSRFVVLMLILPALLLIGLITVYPLFYVVWLSFHRRLLIFNISQFVGWGNYLQLMSDSRFWQAFWNTVYFTGLSVVLELLLGLGIALLLTASFRGQALVRIAVLLPWAIPTVVSAKAWEWMYNADYGLINYLLGVPVNWLGSPWWALNAAVFMDVWKTTPFAAILLLAALKSVPTDLYRAAAIDGAGPVTVFRRITLPSIMPVMLVVLIFRTLDAFRVFDAVYVLTGGGPAGTTETLSIYAYRLLFQTLQFGYGSTVAVTVFMFVALITAGYVLALRRR